jgi:membrane protease YdiL (CAAX protease family)
MNDQGSEPSFGPTPAVPDTRQRAPIQQILELGVFLFLIVPSLVLSLFVIRQGQVSFILAAWATIFRDLALVSLILFFLWRNGETVGHIGWTGRSLGREIVVGIVCFVPFTLGAAKLNQALLRAGLSAPATPLPSFLNVNGLAEMVLGVFLVAVVAVAEETIFRGYLLLRLPVVLQSAIASVLISSAIFAVGHGYEGSAGLVTVGVMGAVFALVYLWRGSLAAPIVMHFLQDFVGIILLPLLKLK